jgi:hypothetical protein
LTAAFGVWLAFTNVVNTETAKWTANSLPPDWDAWRTEWEYSHAARFGLHLCGFVLLTLPVMPAIPMTRDSASDHRTDR